MALDLNALRQKMKQQAAKAEGKNPNSNAVFPFSNLQIGDSVRIRFIDDGENNDVFWRERRTRVIPFNSVKQANGEIVANKAYVDIPAFNLKYNEILLSNMPQNYLYKSEDDVIQKKIASFWDMGDDGKQLYYRYGRKKSYVFQGFVRSDGDYEKNKLYRFMINEELFNLIKSSLSNEEIETIPTDAEKGLDFIINVTGKIANINGKPQEVKDYSTSTWSRKETPLTNEEKQSLLETPPFVLKNFIFERPDVEHEQCMLEMFEASMNEQPYDVVRWGKFYKPNNVFFDADGNIRDVKNSTSKPTEIPAVSENTQTFVQVTNNQATVTQPIPQQFVNPVMQGEINFMNQMQQSMVQPMVQPMVQQVAQPTAPQLINQHSEVVNTSSPEDTVKQLMAKFVNPNG